MLIRGGLFIVGLVSIIASVAVPMSPAPGAGMVSNFHTDHQLQHLKGEPHDLDHHELSGGSSVQAVPLASFYVVPVEGPASVTVPIPAQTLPSSRSIAPLLVPPRLLSV